MTCLALQIERLEELLSERGLLPVMAAADSASSREFKDSLAQIGGLPAELRHLWGWCGGMSQDTLHIPCVGSSFGL